MRPPWVRHSRDEAELEALQTDVMRFIAILGLCLVAIFSLVQGAAQEQASAGQGAVAPAPVATNRVQALPGRPAVPNHETTQEKFHPVEKTVSLPELTRPVAAPEPPPDTTQVGFTLEFASAQALETLLRTGQVQLYASQGSQFWSVDTGGQAVPVQAPSSYYQMQAETVPRRLRETLADTDPGRLTTWGVTLPPEAISRIQQLTSSREGGNLLIKNDGAVTLSTNPGRF